MDQLLSNTIYVLFMVIGTLLLIFGLRRISSDELSSRLDTYVAQPNEEARRWKMISGNQARELSGSLASRLMVPSFKRIGNFLGRLTPRKSTEELRQKLYIAGNPLGLGPREFYGIRIAFGLISILPALVFLPRGVTLNNGLLSILVLIACLLFPVLWLRLLVNARQKEIRRGLPDALDMLSVCVDAGLGFDQALQRVGEHWKTHIAQELNRVVTEMEMGISRKEALRNLAKRLDVNEVSSFVAIILQSDQLGMSIADTLHSQSDQMRVERRYRAQENARTLPIKMLLPLAFMIFPAIMAMLLGPAIPPLLSLITGF